MADLEPTEAMKVAERILDALEGLAPRVAIDFLAGALIARALILGWSEEKVKEMFGTQVDKLYGETLDKVLKHFDVEMPQ